MDDARRRRLHILVSQQLDVALYMYMYDTSTVHRLPVKICADDLKHFFICCCISLKVILKVGHGDFYKARYGYFYICIVLLHTDTLYFYCDL